MDAQEPGGFLAVLEWVDVRQWGLRAGVFAHVARHSARSPGDGVEVSYRTLAEALGCNQRYADTLLRYLKRERVLVLAEKGSGQRPRRWKINPDVRRWREVPWRVLPELAAYRLEGVHMVPSSAPKKPVMPRSYGAAQDPVVPRQVGAAQDEPVPRSHGAAQGESSAALWSAAQGSDDVAGTQFLRVFSSRKLSKREQDDVRAAIAWVEELTDCPVKGRLEDELTELVCVHGFPAVKEDGESFNREGMKSPLFIRTIAGHLDGEGAERIKRSKVEKAIARLGQDRTHALRQLARLEADIAEWGDASDPQWLEEAERLRGEIARCETGLAELDTEGAA